MGTCFEVSKKKAYEKFMLYIYSHLLGGCVCFEVGKNKEY